MDKVRVSPFLSVCDLRGLEEFRLAWAQSPGGAAPSTPTARPRSRSLTPQRTPEPPSLQTSTFR